MVATTSLSALGGGAGPLAHFQLDSHEAAKLIIISKRSPLKLGKSLQRPIPVSHCQGGPTGSGLVSNDDLRVLCFRTLKGNTNKEFFLLPHKRKTGAFDLSNLILEAERLPRRRGECRDEISNLADVLRILPM